MRSNPKNELIDENPWMGPLHLTKVRLLEFVQGRAQLDEQEHAHIIICQRCSRLVADWVLKGLDRVDPEEAARVVNAS